MLIITLTLTCTVVELDSNPGHQDPVWMPHLSVDQTAFVFTHQEVRVGNVSFAFPHLLQKARMPQRYRASHLRVGC